MCVCHVHTVALEVDSTPDGMLTDETRLLHSLGKMRKMFLGLLPSFFANEICGLGFRPYSRTACPVPYYTYFHILNSILFLVHGLWYLSECDVRPMPGGPIPQYPC